MRACVLLAFLAVLLLASTVQAQTRTGFCVSSDIFDGECDVIRDNVVNSQWVDGSYVLQSSLQPLFNITLYPGAPAPATDNVTVTYSTPDGSTNAVWTITEETLTYGQGFFTPLTGSLSCDTEATGSYLITFSSVDLVALTIKFKKQCILPRFDVGSYTHTNNIVDYSVPQKPFQSYVLTEDVQRYDFHVFLSATQSDSQLIILPFSLNLTTPANSILSVTPAKKVGWEGFAMQDPNEFVVGALFSCSNNPLVPVPMTVTATLKDFGWTDRNNIVFTFDYMCGPASPLLGLNVGTTYGTNDVAVNGQAVAPWNSTAFHYAAEVTYTFVLFLSSTVNNNTIPYQINIISEDESTLIITPTTPTNGTLFWTEGSPDVQVFLSEFVCFKAGTVNALAQLRMGEYDPVQMLFSYTCSAPLFNIGTSAGSSNMVSKGVGVGGNGTFPGQNVDKDHDSVDIYLALDPSNTADTNPFHIDFLEPNKNVFSGVTYSDRLAAVASKDLARSAQNPVTLNFECLPCVEAYQEPIVVVFYWGWTNPQTAVFTKDCAVAESCKNPPPSGHHGGMSRAGIAALVIFLLSFAACVAGCAYNKFSLHKGGWAIVPGATAASACFDQVSTKGRSQRWTPQEHDDGSHSANYNAGQEPLATGGYQSYSSNI